MGALAILAALGCTAGRHVAEKERPCDPSEWFEYLSVLSSEDEPHMGLLNYWMDAWISEVGERVGMAVVVKNPTLDIHELLLLNGPPQGFVVTTPECEVVWRSAKSVDFEGYNHIFYPFSEKRFFASWQLIDQEERPVPPGVYLVHGALDLGEPEGVLVTGPLRVDVTTVRPFHERRWDKGVWCRPGPLISLAGKGSSPWLGNKNLMKVGDCGSPDVQARAAEKHGYEIMKRYKSRLMCHPNVHDVSYGNLQGDDGEDLETWGIIIEVYQDQSALQAGDRIPDCLHGVPVQFRPRGPDEYYRPRRKRRGFWATKG